MNRNGFNLKTRIQTFKSKQVSKILNSKAKCLFLTYFNSGDAGRLPKFCGDTSPANFGSLGQKAKKMPRLKPRHGSKLFA
ncbi:hypothetical protein DRW42_25635 [Pedobacter miscanthi]|uniref:Uncharacterized protein n=1 Tax=Pedobacter miscanthi TaxID=2259170 RepID=A0A366KN74_9SPHI|nr:hypothetical protein DRW42_25635 [Pedobacter miscanthi]